MKALTNSFEIIRWSCHILWLDKWLIGVTLLIYGMSLLFLVAIFTTFGFGETLGELVVMFKQQGAEQFVDIIFPDFLKAHAVLLIVIYFVFILLNSLSQAIIILAVNDRLNGHVPDPMETIWDSLGKLKSLFMWSFLQLIFSLLVYGLQVMSKSDAKGGGNFLSSLFADLVTTAGILLWSMVTFLMLPVLIIEERTLVKTLKRSWELLKKTWGENISLNIAIGALSSWLMVILGIIAGFMFFAGNYTQCFILFFVGVFVISFPFSIFEGVWRTALYHYAMYDEIPHGMNEKLVKTAFRDKDVN